MGPAGPGSPWSAGRSHTTALPAIQNLLIHVLMYLEHCTAVTLLVTREVAASEQVLLYTVSTQLPVAMLGANLQHLL